MTLAESRQQGRPAEARAAAAPRFPRRDALRASRQRAERRRAARSEQQAVVRWLRELGGGHS